MSLSPTETDHEGMTGLVIFHEPPARLLQEAHVALEAGVAREDGGAVFFGSGLEVADGLFVAHMDSEAKAASVVALSCWGVGDLERRLEAAFGPGFTLDDYDSAVPLSSAGASASIGRGQVAAGRPGILREALGGFKAGTLVRWGDVPEAEAYMGVDITLPDGTVVREHEDAVLLSRSMVIPSADELARRGLREAIERAEAEAASAAAPSAGASVPRLSSDARFVVAMIHEGSDWSVREATPEEMADDEEKLTLAEARDLASRSAAEFGCRWFDLTLEDERHDATWSIGLYTNEQLEAMTVEEYEAARRSALAGAHPDAGTPSEGEIEKLLEEALETFEEGQLVTVVAGEYAGVTGKVSEIESHEYGVSVSVHVEAAPDGLLSIPPGESTFIDCSPNEIADAYAPRSRQWVVVRQAGIHSVNYGPIVAETAEAAVTLLTTGRSAYTATGRGRYHAIPLEVWRAGAFDYTKTRGAVEVR